MTASLTYIHWSLIGMVAYSVVSLVVKLATRSGTHPSFTVLAVATSIVAIVSVWIAFSGGHFAAMKRADLISVASLWTIIAGIFLTIAVASFFKALSMGPASEVVPIYGMFVVGGSLLGILFLGESLSFSKVAGIFMAAAAIYLITK